MALLLVALLVAPALCQDGGLGLTPQQVKAIHAIRCTYAARRHKVEKRLKQKKVELLELLQSPSVQRDEVNDKLSEIMELELERQHLYVNEMFDCRSQMNADQWSTFRQRVIKAMLKGD